MYSIVFVLCGYVWPQSMSSLNFSLLFTLSTFGIVRHCILLSSYITLDRWPYSLSSLHYSLRCIWIPPGCIRLESIASRCQLHQDRLWGCLHETFSTSYVSQLTQVILNLFIADKSVLDSYSPRLNFQIIKCEYEIAPNVLVGPEMFFW